MVLCSFNRLQHILQGGLLEERDVGVLMAVVTLLLGIVSRNYEGAVPLATSGQRSAEGCHGVKSAL